MSTGDWGTLVVLAGATFAALAIGVRRRRLAAYAYGATCVLALLWTLALWLSLSGLGDADAWVDCNSSCSTLQHITGALLTWGALLTLLVAVIGIAAVIGRRRPP
jgi:hypothetical protein